MDNLAIETVEQQVDKLEEILQTEAMPCNSIEKIALGMLCKDVQHLWWRSDEPFHRLPSPALQDELSLFAQHTWQRWRDDPTFAECLSLSTHAYQQSDMIYRWDLDLHMQYPELSLIKFWSASVSSTRNTESLTQAQLWQKHLLLTQSMLLAQQQKVLNPHCLIGYAEENIMIIDINRRKVVVASHASFDSYTMHGLTFYHITYPK